MKKKAPCADSHTAVIAIRVTQQKQQGDALLEALVGMLLIAVLGLGLAYAAGRAMNAQRYAATHGIVLAEMRQAIESTGIKALCDGSGFTINPLLPDGSRPINLSIARPTCTSQAINVSVSGDLAGSATVITDMQLSTPITDAAKKQLGPGAIILKQ